MQLPSLSTGVPLKLETVDNALKRVENVATNIAGASVFLMAIIITIDVTGRYALSSPLQGTHEFVEFYLMPLTVYFTIAHVERNDANIRVTLIYDQLRTTHKRIVEVGYRMSMVFVLLFLIQKTSVTALEFVREGQAVYGLDLPLGYSWVIVPIGFALLTVRLTIDSVKLITGDKEVYNNGSH